jgi:ribosomal protein L22
LRLAKIAATTATTNAAKMRNILRNIRNAPVSRQEHYLTTMGMKPQQPDHRELNLFRD